jgi:glycosyltransferase involved in cell wall biosynthesis
VVTTPTGIEGIKARDGQEVLIRHDSQGLAQATGCLLIDKKLAGTISQKARQLVCRDYDWGTIAQSLDKIYKEVGGERS